MSKTALLAAGAFAAGKNKGNQTPPTPQQVQAQTQVQTESVKEAIKKTIDKYYTANKTNGWVKE